MCMALSVAGCTSPQGEESHQPAVNGTNSKENENQGKLDVIKPLAYSNVYGLNLEPGTTFSIIGKGKSSAYWSEVKKGAEQAVEDINTMMEYKGEDKVKMTYSAPGTELDVDDQVNILDEELARYPSALGIAAVDSSACEVQFDLAAENGIPIVAFDSGTDYHDIVAMVDTDNRAAASIAANRLCDSIGDSGEVILLVHDSKSTSAKQREEGFLKALSEKGDAVKAVHVYHLDELEDMQKLIAAERRTAEGTESDEASDEKETEDQGTDITQEEVVAWILQQHPDAKGIYTTNETAAKLALNVVKGLKDRHMKIVSFDGGEDMLKALEDGSLEALIVQNPYGIGYATIVACARAVLEQGNEASVNTGFTLVTKENKSDKTVKRMLY